MIITMYLFLKITYVDLSLYVARHFVLAFVCICSQTLQDMEQG
jgi:hypothetical protein